MTTQDAIATPATLADDPTIMVVDAPPAHDGDPPVAAPARRAGTDVRRLAKIGAWWVASALIGVVIVLYVLSPILAQRDQHRLLGAYATAVRDASLQATGFLGLQLPTQPPVTGSTVGILEVGRLHLQQAVLEGVGPAQTEKGPGHVPGTAGLGQAGNAVVVGRRAAFGRPFAHLSALRRGDPIVVTTTEGQSLYDVEEVHTVKLRDTAAVDSLYASGSGNQLTLVTSASDVPWNRATATVVVARMVTQPFTPTPQQSLSPSQEGRSAAPGAWAPLLLALQAFVLVAVGAVVLYRRVPLRTAYLVTTAPLVVVTILLALAVSRSLPAWT